MALLVLDTSVIIDLERGGLLEATFKLDHVFVAPDLVYEKELRNDVGPYLLELGLQIVELDSDEMMAAQALKSAQPGLSHVDCWVATCAHRMDHRLLTGDGTLRAHAETMGIACSGVLWVMDQAHDADVATSMALSEALERVSQHPKSRLPKEEVEKRLKRWKKAHPKK